MRILIYTAIIGMLLSAGQDWVAIGSFKLNQKEIADKWCVNKEKKGSCCAGKCFLTNVLDDLHDEDQQNGTLPEMVERLPFLPLVESLIVPTFSEALQTENVYFNNRIRGVLSVHEIFHPPQV